MLRLHLVCCVRSGAFVCCVNIWRLHHGHDSLASTESCQVYRQPVGSSRGMQTSYTAFVERKEPMQL